MLRKRIADEESTLLQVQEELEKLRSIPPSIWHKIEDWGKVTGELSEQRKTVAYNLAGRIRNNSKISDFERQTGNAIIDTVIEKAPELLEQIDDLNKDNNISSDKLEITIELINKIVLWDKKNKDSLSNFLQKKPCSAVTKTFRIKTKQKRLMIICNPLLKI
jgi:hypothetical protein